MTRPVSENELWPDIYFGPVNLWVVVPAHKWYT